MLEFIDTVIIPFFLDIYDAIGYVGVAFAVALETFIPIIPSEVIVPMAGWKVSQSAADASVLEPLTQAPWTFIGVLAAATLGAVAGSLAGYLIGAWGGRPLLDRYGRYVHIYPDDLDRADAWFARYGDRAVFFARLVPLLRALINYPAGVARMPVGRFLFFSVLVLVGLVLLGGIYFIYTWTNMKASPGQRIMGLMTVSEADGSALSFNSALARYVIMFAPGYIASLSFLVLNGFLALLVWAAGVAWTVFLVWTTVDIALIALVVASDGGDWSPLRAMFFLPLFFAVGAAISLFTGRGALAGGARMLAIGACAGALTYLLGRLLGVSLG